MSRKIIMLNSLGIQQTTKYLPNRNRKYISWDVSNQSKPNKYFSFDRSIHLALAAFNNIASKQAKSLEKLRSLLKDNWISIGYDSLEEESQFMLRGMLMMASYYLNPLDIGTDIFIIDKLLKAEIKRGVNLIGKLDKVYEKENGDIEIIDYKSGKVIHHQNEFPLDYRTSVMLLLVQDYLGITPSFISYYYLSYNRKFTHTVTVNDLAFSYSLVLKVSRSKQI